MPSSLTVINVKVQYCLFFSQLTMLKSDIDMYETQVKDLEDELDTERNKNDRLDKIVSYSTI